MLINQFFIFHEISVKESKKNFIIKDNQVNVKIVQNKSGLILLCFVIRKKQTHSN